MLWRDQDWRIRYEVASRAAVSELTGLLEDRDSLVREAALSRVARRPDREVGSSA